jgi:hypothetical protein
MKILLFIIAGFIITNNCYGQKSYGKLVVEFDVKSDTVYTKADLTGDLPDSVIAWINDITKKLSTSAILKNHPKKGKYSVTVQFILDKEGQVSDVKALTNHGYGMEEEAVRAIRKGPKWLPSPTNGRPVNRYRSAHDFYLFNTDSIVKAIDHSKNLTSTNFTITAHKKVRHSILYTLHSDLNGIVKISRQFSYKNDSISQTFYLQKDKLIYATEKIVSHYKNDNVVDSITWGGSFYFLEGKLIYHNTLGHGKSEDENWDPQKTMLRAYEESKRDIERYKKNKL